MAFPEPGTVVEIRRENGELMDDLYGLNGTRAAKHPQQPTVERGRRVMKGRALMVGVSLALWGCSDDGGDGAVPAAGAGGATGQAGSAGASPGGTGGSDTGSSGSGSGGMPSAGTGGSPSGGGGSGFADSGVCGVRGEGPVSESAFSGFEEFYLIGENGFGTDICVVRFDVARVGEAPGGCDECAWTHQVEYGNPQIVTDVNGVCASSELGMDSARIDEIEGSQAYYGFVFEYSGHVSVLMKYDEATSTWGPNGTASWSEETGLRFDRRDGYCGY